MSRMIHSTALIALLVASGSALAQNATTTQQTPEVQQPGTVMPADCPPAGTVPESQLREDCKAGTATGADNSGAVQPKVPGAADDNVTTGSTNPPADNNTTAATPPANTAGDSNSTTASGAPLPAGAEFLASQFMGRTVYSGANESVGEINDLILNKDLDTIVAIIGVGGFLGIGEKDVAIPIEEITVGRDANNAPILTIASTRDQLEAAPAFDRTALAR